MLQWLDVASLVVDPSYQRPIDRVGRQQINAIAENFAWSCFAPVIVSPVEGGKFTIIDGQHRTTAAIVVGIEKIPCQVVILPRNEQAAAFRAINGVTLPMSRMALHAAAVTSGDKSAAELEQLAKRAGIEILRYPISVEKMTRKQTFAVAALYRCASRFGDEVLVTALRCIYHASSQSVGNYTARNIKAVCALLQENQKWREAEQSLFSAFGRLNLKKLNEDVTRQVAEQKMSREQALVGKLKDHLEASMARA